MSEVCNDDNRIEIRNEDGRLVGIMYETVGIFEILNKACITLLKFPPGTKIIIENMKKPA